VYCCARLLSFVLVAVAATASGAAAQPALFVGPDQSVSLAPGDSGTYQFYVQLDDSTGAVVELRRPHKPRGWNFSYCDTSGKTELADTDGDQNPDLGRVTPGTKCRFAVKVVSPPWLVGDVEALDQLAFPLVGFVADHAEVTDTGLLTLSRPADSAGFSVHCFPNPLTTSTRFVIGLPEDGRVSLTIYTRAGERVRRVMDSEVKPAGVHVVSWDASNDRGQEIMPGTYEYVIDYSHQGKTDRIRKRLVVRR